MNHLWLVYDRTFRTFCSKIRSETSLPPSPHNKKKEGKTPRWSSKFRLALLTLQNPWFWGFQHSHPRPATPPVFLEEPGFFHKKETDPAGLEVSINCPKSEQNIGKKNRSNKKEKPISVKKIFHLQPCGSGRWKLQRKTSGIFTGQMKRDLKFPIGKIQFEDFLTESSLVFKKPTRMKKKHNPNLPIPGDAKIGAWIKRLGPSPF